MQNARYIMQNAECKMQKPRKQKFSKIQTIRIQRKIKFKCSENFKIFKISQFLNSEIPKFFKLKNPKISKLQRKIIVIMNLCGVGLILKIVIMNLYGVGLFGTSF